MGKRSNSGKLIVIDDVHGIVVSYTLVRAGIAGEVGGIAVITTAGPQGVDDGEVEMGTVGTVAAVARTACNCDLSTLVDSLTDGYLQAGQVGIERVNSLAGDGVLDDDEATIGAAVGRGGCDDGTAGSGIDLAAGAVDVDAQVVVTITGTIGVGRPAHVGVRGPGAVRIVHGHTPTGGGGAGAGCVGGQGHLVLHAGYFVISARGNGVDGGIVGFAVDGVCAELHGSVACGDGTVGGHTRGGTHAVSGVLGRCGVGSDSDRGQTEDVIGSEPTAAEAGAAGAGGICNINSSAVRRDLGNHNLIAEGVDVITGGLGAESGVRVAVYSAGTTQGHGVGDQGKLAGQGGSDAGRGGGGHGTDEGHSTEQQHQCQNESSRAKQIVLFHSIFPPKINLSKRSCS